GSARFGNAEIAAGSGAAAFHFDSGLGDAEQLSGLMFRQNAGDVIIDYDDFIDFAVPLFREHSDGGGAAAYAHPLFLDAIDNRRLACLDNHGCAFIDGEFDGLAVAQVQKRLAGHGAFAAAASGEVANSAEREHLRSIFAGGDVAYRLAL